MPKMRRRGTPRRGMQLRRLRLGNAGQAALAPSSAQEGPWDALRLASLSPNWREVAGEECVSTSLEGCGKALWKEMGVYVTS